MEQERYRVEFSGRIAEGLTVAEVQRRLSARFNLPLEKVEVLFTGRPRTLKRGIERRQAEEYVRAFAAAGAECVVVPEAASAAAAPPVASTQPLPVAPAPAPARIAGFWVRPAALLADMVLLTGLGMLLGAFFFEPLVKLGQAGRLVGFGIALLYFGLLNSSLGGGQTLGKRLLRIRVVDAASGTGISPARAAGRYLLLGLPYFCNNLVLPFDNTFLVLLVTLIVFGLGGVTIYLYLCNRRCRQTLHDLASRTLVVQVAPAGPPHAVGLWKGHWVVAGLWMLLLVGGALFGVPRLSQTRPFATLVALQRTLAATPGVAAAQVNSGVTYAGGGQTQWTTVTVSVREAQLFGDDLADTVASTTLAQYPDIQRKDQLTVRIVYGYDIGISSRWQDRSYSLTPKQWAARLKVVEL